MCLTPSSHPKTNKTKKLISFNPVTTANKMEASGHVTRLPSTCPTRLTSQFTPKLDPLLPGKDNKRKRLNAVLDKLASNITKVSDDNVRDNTDILDSPEKSLALEINVKTKFKKDDTSEDTSCDSDDCIAPPEEASDSNVSPLKRVVSAVSSLGTSQHSSTFLNTLLKSPKCDENEKQETYPLPTLATSYEDYIKSHILSKMYLQQYCNNLTNIKPDQSIATTRQKDEKKSKTSENSSLDGPLDLSTPSSRQNSETSPGKDQLYSKNFPFASLQLQQMLLESNKNVYKDPSSGEKSSPVSVPASPEKTASTSCSPNPCSVPTKSSTSKDLSYVCPVCGQMFSLHDRLAKHMASRHKSKPVESSSKAYFCDVCKRSFARSDMLTRHMRLHTGIKPYTCRVCGQVFSRSDHLSTHQRTHTGEKPYKCPSCPYSACRRDMITRHMRTHSRYELQNSENSSATVQILKEREVSL